jgi:hypothetical protein
MTKEIEGLKMGSCRKGRWRCDILLLLLSAGWIRKATESEILAQHRDPAVILTCSTKLSFRRLRKELIVECKTKKSAVLSVGESQSTKHRLKHCMTYTSVHTSLKLAKNFLWPSQALAFPRLKTSTTS